MTDPASGQSPADSTADSTTQLDEVNQEWEANPLTEPELAVDRKARGLQDGPDGSTPDDVDEAERIAQRPDF